MNLIVAYYPLARRKGTVAPPDPDPDPVQLTAAQNFAALSVNDEARLTWTPTYGNNNQLLELSENGGAFSFHQEFSSDVSDYSRVQGYNTNCAYRLTQKGNNFTTLDSEPVTASLQIGAAPQPQQDPILPQLTLMPGIVNYDVSPKVTVTCEVKSAEPVASETSVYFRVTRVSTGGFANLQGKILQGSSTGTLTFPDDQEYAAFDLRVTLLQKTTYTLGSPSERIVTIPALEAQEPEPEPALRTYSTSNEAVQKSVQQLAAGDSAYNTALNGLKSRTPLSKAAYTVGDAANKPTMVTVYYWNDWNTAAPMNSWQPVKNVDGTDFRKAYDYAPLSAAEAKRTHYTWRTYFGPKFNYPAPAENATAAQIREQRMAYMRTNLGEPYDNVDGKTYPEVKNFRNSKNASDMCHDLFYLGIYHHFATGADKTTAANKLAEFAKAYFHSPTTGMKPHLLFGQVAKGLFKNYGDVPGFVDFEAFSQAIDGLRLAEADMPAADVTAMKAWVRAFWTWYTVKPVVNASDSQQVKDEKDAHIRIVNGAAGAHANIRIFYECCVCQMALYLGEEQWVKDRMNSLYPGLLGKAFDMAATSSRSGGRQGAALTELGRSRPWTYSNKNLNGWMELARIASGVGIDLWNMKGSNNVTLKIAMRWQAYYAQNPTAWNALPKGGSEDNSTTSSVYFFREGARTCKKIWPADTELVNWCNNYQTLKDNKFKNSQGVPDPNNPYTEAGFLNGKDWERLIQLHTDVP